VRSKGRHPEKCLNAILAGRKFVEKQKRMIPIASKAMIDHTRDLLDRTEKISCQYKSR
jgi:hypothetical protein